MGGEIIHQHDKMVARECSILWRIDAAEVLSRFARQCAMDVTYLWAPSIWIWEYLRTGHESLRDSTCKHAIEVGEDTRSLAVRWAACAAAHSTSPVALDAARTSAYYAAKAADWPTGSPLHLAARAAVRIAAWIDVLPLGWAEAWAAARVARISADAQNTCLRMMIELARPLDIEATAIEFGV